jgi:hypothetical protein
MSTFGKKSGCPSSERVLGYIRKSLSPSAARRVSSHAANCDFCGAEMLFMARHTPYEDYTPGPTSRHLAGSETVLISQTIYQNQERRAA